MSRPSGSGYVEYRLRSTATSNLTHNIMILNTPSVTLKDFTPPVRLIREPDESYAMEVDEDDDAGKELAILAGRQKRKKTRMVQIEDEEESALKEQEASPWLLEDFDGQHAFSGRLQGGQQGSYVVFVNQGSEFRVIPVAKWYRFYPKLVYKPLTLDEAEAQLLVTKKHEDTDRWLMRRRNASSSASLEDAEEGVGSSSGQKLKGKISGKVKGKSSKEPVPQAVGTGQRLGTVEEIDYDEIFDDDEGTELFDYDDDDPTMPKVGAKDAKQAPRNKLSSVGKEVRKLMRHLDKSNYYESGDENDDDPYADDDDKDSSSLSDVEAAREREKAAAQAKTLAAAAATRLQPKTQEQAKSKPSVPSSPKSSPATPIGSPRQSLGSSAPGSSAKRPLFASQPLPGTSSKKVKTSAGDSSMNTDALISEAEIIEYLREAPLRTKDLIAKVKPKLKADPRNKDLFRELVKKVAAVRQGGGSEDDRLLELKPEFR